MKIYNNLIIAAALLIASTVHAKDVLTLIIPTAPGGASHRYALFLAEHLRQKVDMSVIVVPKPGAEGTLAAKSLIDCHENPCILLSSVKAIKDRTSGQVVDLTTDITPIAYAGSIPQVIYVRSDSKFTSLESIVNSNEKLSYGVAQQSPVRGIIKKILKNNTSIVEVTYKSGGQSLLDVLSGNLSFGSTVPDILAPLEKAGRVRILSVVSKDKSLLLPKSPLLHVTKDLVDDLDVSYSSYFIFTSKDANPKLTAIIGSAINEYLTGPDSQQIINEMDINLLVKQNDYNNFLNKILLFN